MRLISEDTICGLDSEPRPGPLGENVVVETLVNRQDSHLQALSVWILYLVLRYTNIHYKRFPNEALRDRSPGRDTELTSKSHALFRSSSRPRTVNVDPQIPPYTTVWEHDDALTDIEPPPSYRS